MMLSSYCLLVKQDGCAVGGWGGAGGTVPGEEGAAERWVPAGATRSTGAGSGNQ